MVLSRGTIDFDDLRCFLAVVDHASVTVAARALGVPKSSVSRRVASLESSLGVSLLRRSTRSIVPTDAGRRYAGEARRALGILGDAARCASDVEEGPVHGRVRVTATPDIAREHLIRPIAEVRREHPDVHVELLLTPRRVDLVAEGVDLGIRVGTPGSDALVAKKLTTLEAHVVASPDYLRRRGRPASPDELADHAWVDFLNIHAVGELRLRSPTGKEHPLPRKFEVAADEVGFCIAAAEAGLGLTLLPASLVSEAVRKGLLEVVLPRHVVAGPPLWLVYPKDRFASRAVTAVRDAIVQSFKR